MIEKIRPSTLLELHLFVFYYQLQHLLASFVELYLSLLERWQGVEQFWKSQFFAGLDYCFSWLQQHESCLKVLAGKGQFNGPFNSFLNCSSIFGIDFLKFTPSFAEAENPLDPMVLETLLSFFEMDQLLFTLLIGFFILLNTNQNVTMVPKSSTEIFFFDI